MTRNVGYGQLDRRLHVAFLSFGVASSVATGPWRASLSPLAAFAVYGALHALTVVAALRGRQAVARGCAFVLAAAMLCAGTAALGFHAMTFASRLPGRMGLCVLLGVLSAAGALAYAALIRVFAIAEMPRRHIAAAALACPLAVFALLETGIYASLGAYLAVSIAWWCAFSAALCRFGR